tara:strand:+ start:3048 stop:3929 length:882 start_codon:yes stop_codon:yes gene_type:complete
MYSKIQVNTPSAISVIKSDTYNIPNPGRLVFAGTTSSNTNIVDITACANIFTSITTSAGGGNLLVDSIPITGTPPRGLDFTKNSNISAAQSATSLAQSVRAIQVGNQVQETATNATGQVVSIDSSSQLTLNSIIANDVGDNYILRQNGFINRLDVNVGYLVYNLTDLTQNFVTAVTNDAQLSVGGGIISANDEYQIYSQNAADLSVNNANTAALIYVGSNAAIVQDINNDQATPAPAFGTGTADPRYVDITVTTANNQKILFSNFKVGEYLPVQCVKVWNTGTDAAVRPIAIF